VPRLDQGSTHYSNFRIQGNEEEVKFASRHRRTVLGCTAAPRRVAPVPASRWSIVRLRITLRDARGSRPCGERRLAAALALFPLGRRSRRLVRILRQPGLGCTA
jgi:hypothetical protein